MLHVIFTSSSHIAWHWCECKCSDHYHLIQFKTSSLPRNVIYFFITAKYYMRFHCRQILSTSSLPPNSICREMTFLLYIPLNAIRIFIVAKFHLDLHCRQMPSSSSLLWNAICIFTHCHQTHLDLHSRQLPSASSLPPNFACVFTVTKQHPLHSVLLCVLEITDQISCCEIVTSITSRIISLYLMFTSSRPPNTNFILLTVNYHLLYPVEKNFTPVTQTSSIRPYAVESLDMFFKMYYLQLH